MSTSRYVSELERVRTLYNGGIAPNFTNLIEVSKRVWAEFAKEDELSLEEFARLGEIFRRAAIVCVAVDHKDAALWRSRSLALFTLARSSNGVAMLILAAGLGSYDDGDFKGALAQLELMNLLVSPNDEILSLNLVRSAMLENTGIVQIALEEWESARRTFFEVIEIEEATGDFRRIQKAKASLTTIEYRVGSRDAALADLTQIVDECRSNGLAGTVVETGEVNLETMRLGEWPLLPYQVI